MPFTLEQSADLCEIRVGGAINIADAAGWKECLLQALAAGTEIRLRLEPASELGVTTLQLLWAAKREAGASGTKFTVMAPIPEEIAIAVKDSGFEQFLLSLDSKAQ